MVSRDYLRDNSERDIFSENIGKSTKKEFGINPSRTPAETGNSESEDLYNLRPNEEESRKIKDQNDTQNLRDKIMEEAKRREKKA
jgi:hypothetical protein